MSVGVVERVRSRIQEIRARRPLLGQTRGQQVIGGGALIEKTRQRLDQITARIKERKPLIVPKIKEWKPGSRIREILAPQTYYGGVMDRPGMSVETEPEQRKIAEDRGIAVEW